MKPLGCSTLYLKKTHWEKTLPVCGVNVEILRMLLINGKKWHVKKIIQCIMQFLLEKQTL